MSSLHHLFVYRITEPSPILCSDETEKVPDTATPIRRDPTAAYPSPTSAPRPTIGLLRPPHRQGPYTPARNNSYREPSPDQFQLDSSPIMPTRDLDFSAHDDQDNDGDDARTVMHDGDLAERCQLQNEETRRSPAVEENPVVKQLEARILELEEGLQKQRQLCAEQKAVIEQCRSDKDAQQQDAAERIQSMQQRLELGNSTVRQLRSINDT